LTSTTKNWWNGWYTSYFRALSVHEVTLHLPPAQVTRNKLPNDWHKRVQAIQAKIAEARADLPPNLLQGILGSTDAGIDYFHATAIRDELMKTTDRNFFGSATGEAAIWEKIVKAYEKNGSTLHARNRCHLCLLACPCTMAHIVAFLLLRCMYRWRFPLVLSKWTYSIPHMVLHSHECATQACMSWQPP
jgi:hypothetical protein